MNYFVLLLLMFIAPIVSYAGIIDTSYIKVTYDVTSKARTEDKKLAKSQEVLLIGRDQSLYYSLQQELYLDYVDSMKRANPNEDPTLLYTSKDLPESGNSYRIYKNLANGDIVYTNKIWSAQFEYNQNSSAFDWVIAEGDSTICSYPCKKALLDLHGRKWTVWYALDIPISDGPWKLCGLPGLILEARESEGIFSFTCSGIEKVAIPISYESKHTIKTTPKGFQEELTDFWQDQGYYILRLNNFPFGCKMRGLADPFHPCLMERY